jgi:NifU-like protein involved in Fe-S cluster formation
MSMSMDDLELRSFDPPCLGMPGRPSHAGRWEEDARFVEIFVTVEGGMIEDVGFLTSIPETGLVCASLYCEELLGKTLEEAWSLQDKDILDRFPGAMRKNAALVELAGICVLAGQKAINSAKNPD